MLKPIFAALGLAACASIPAHAGTSPGFRDDPAVITEWNTIAEAAIPASAGVTLPRTYAMMHIAMFDAVNSIDGGYTAFYVRVPAWYAASREAAAAQAAHDVLTALLPAGTATYRRRARRTPGENQSRACAARQPGRQRSGPEGPGMAQHRWLVDTPDVHTTRVPRRVATDAPGVCGGGFRAGG